MAAPGTWHNVAISYAPGDAPLVRRIRAVLAAGGYSVYMCEREPGAAALDEVLYALLRADAVVICASPSYAADETCRVEAAAVYALMEVRKRNVCIANVGPAGFSPSACTTRPTGVPACLTGTLADVAAGAECCDLAGSASAEAFDHAVRRLLQLLDMFRTTRSYRGGPVTRAGAAAVGAAAGGDRTTPAPAPTASILLPPAAALAPPAVPAACYPPSLQQHADPFHAHPFYAHPCPCYAHPHCAHPPPYPPHPFYGYGGYGAMPLAVASTPATAVPVTATTVAATPVAPELLHRYSYASTPAQVPPPPAVDTPTTATTVDDFASAALPGYDARCIAINKSNGHRCKLVARDKAIGLCSTHIRYPPRKTAAVRTVTAAALTPAGGAGATAADHVYDRRSAAVALPVPEVRTGTMQCAGFAKTTGKRCRIAVSAEKQYCHHHRR